MVKENESRLLALGEGYLLHVNRMRRIKFNLLDFAIKENKNN